MNKDANGAFLYYLLNRQIEPWFVTGLVDGDGIFTIITRIIRDNLYFNGCFKIAGDNNKATNYLFTAVKGIFQLCR